MAGDQAPETRNPRPRVGMSSDTKAIIATVVAIGGLVLGQGFYLNARTDDVHRRIDDLRSEMNRRLDDMQADIRELRTEVRADIRELREIVINVLKGSEPAAD